MLAMFFASAGKVTGQIIGISDITLYFNILVIFSFIIFLVEDNFKISFKILPTYFLLFVFFSFIHIIITYSFIYPDEFFKNDLFLADNVFINVLRYLVFLIFVYVFVLRINYNYFKSLTLAFSLGFLLTFLLTFIAVLQGSISLDPNDEGRFSGGGSNANNFGAASFMVLFLNIYILIREFGIKHRIIFFQLLFIIISFTGALLSGSRMIVYGILLALIYTFKQIPGYGKKLKFSFIALLVILIIYLIFPYELFDNVINRITHHSLSGENAAQESRVLIWSEYLFNIGKYFWTGIGFDREISISTIGLQPHNEYLIVLVRFGILGLILYLATLSQFYILLKKNISSLIMGTQKKYASFLLMGFFISWIFVFLNVGQFANSREYWLMIAIIIGSKNILY